MKGKTIKGILRRKFQDFLASIEDERTRELVGKNSIITGGSIASLLLNEKVNDFDIYFTDKETTLAVAHYYVKEFTQNPPPRFKNSKLSSVPIFVEDAEDRVKIVIKSAGIASEEGDGGQYQYFEQESDPESVDAMDYVNGVMTALQESEEDGDKKPYRPVFLSSNAITLSHHIQLVLRFYGEPEVIHENYDFVHCMNYWESKDGKLTLLPQALESLLAKELRYHGSKYPICSLIRLRKFLKRGWTVNAGQILKMCMQVSKLDLNDISVLEDQLTGVDVAYFQEVLDKLREKGENRVDSAYIVEIIDRMF
jgi:hypothetical protein